MDSRKAQRRAEQERDEAVEARFTAKTVLEALKLAEACFPDRLVVLTSARASAETSPYRDPERVFESLAVLAFFGRNDGDCEAAFQKVTGGGARWKPKDSPETSSRFGPQRTWADSDGKREHRRGCTLIRPPIPPTRKHVARHAKRSQGHPSGDQGPKYAG